MRTLPLAFRLDGQPTALIGGDDRALSKAELLLQAGAKVVLYSDNPGVALSALLKQQSMMNQRSLDLVADAAACPRLAVVGWEQGTERAELIRLARMWQVPVNVVDAADDCDFFFPALVDRGDVRVAITTGAQSPFLALLLRGRLEAMLPAGLEVLATLLAEVTQTLRVRKLSAAARRQLLEQIAEGAAGVAAEAGNLERARQLAQAQMAGSKPLGYVSMVGAGPGHPGLLTLRGLQLLQRADTVLYDRLVSEEVLALARREAGRVLVGKSPGGHSIAQEEINCRLVELAREGQHVCRLKGGDPFIFGRGGEELQTIVEAGIALEVVPGINAASGCAAWAGIPLTHRDFAHSCVFLAAHGQPGAPVPDWQKLLSPGWTAAVFMPLARLAAIGEECRAARVAADWPVALVESGTLPAQRVLRSTIGEVAVQAQQQGFQSPALLICGEVTRLSNQLINLDESA